MHLILLIMPTSVLTFALPFNLYGMQNSKFLRFLSKMSQGDFNMDENQFRPPVLSAPGDWANEYQQQYNKGQSWADQFASEEASRDVFLSTFACLIFTLLYMV